MFCPVCKAEYRPGFHRCADCDVELVGSLREAERATTAPPERYGALLWRGEDPHFYVNLLGWLGREMDCYGKPERPAPPKYDGDPGIDAEPGEFEVWVPELDLDRAKWLLQTVSQNHEDNPPEDRNATRPASKKAGIGEQVGVCPLCFAEFASASSLCPNCNVPLHAGEIAGDEDTGARVLCQIWHPQFAAEVRRALQAARIPFNNGNYSETGIILGRGYVPSYKLLVLDADFERATQVMARVLQHWEFEPAAGFGPRPQVEKSFWPRRAEENDWQPQDLGLLLWTGANLGVARAIGLALREHEVPYRMDELEHGTTKIFIHPNDEADGREVVVQVAEGVPPA